MKIIYTTNWIERFNKNCKRTKERNSYLLPHKVALTTRTAIKKEKKYTYQRPKIRKSGFHSVNLQAVKYQSVSS